MCCRTRYIVKGFASAQQRKSRKVHAEPAVQGKPFVRFENRYPIEFSEVHGISSVSYVRNIRENGQTHEYSYISCKAPYTALPFPVQLHATPRLQVDYPCQWHTECLSIW